MPVIKLEIKPLHIFLLIILVLNQFMRPLQKTKYMVQPEQKDQTWSQFNRDISKILDTRNETFKSRLPNNRVLKTNQQFKNMHSGRYSRNPSYV